MSGGVQRENYLLVGASRVLKAMDVLGQNAISDYYSPRLAWD